MFFKFPAERVLADLNQTHQHYSNDEIFGLETLQPALVKTYDALAKLYKESHLLNILADKVNLDQKNDAKKISLRAKQQWIQAYLQHLKDAEVRQQKSEALAQQPPRSSSPISERAQVHLDQVTDTLQRVGKYSHLTLYGLVNAYHVLQHLEALLISAKHEVSTLPTLYRLLRRIPKIFLERYETHIDQQQILLHTEYQGLVEAMYSRLKYSSDHHNFILANQLDTDIAQLNKLGIATIANSPAKSVQVFDEASFTLFHHVIRQQGKAAMQQAVLELQWFKTQDPAVNRTVWHYLGTPKPRFSFLFKGRSTQHHYANDLYKRAYLSCEKTNVLKTLARCEITMKDLRSTYHALQTVERLWQFEWQNTQKSLKSLSGWRRLFTRQTQQLLKQQLNQLQSMATELIEVRVSVTEQLSHALDQKLLTDIRHSDDRELLLAFIDTPAELPRTTAFNAVIKQSKQALIKSIDTTLAHIDEAERTKAHQATEDGLLIPFTHNSATATEADAMALLTYLSHIPKNTPHPFVARVQKLLPQLRNSLPGAFLTLTKVQLPAMQLRQVVDDLIAKIELLTVLGSEEDKHYFEQQFHQLACDYVSRWGQLNINETTTLEQHHVLSEQQEAILLRYATTQQQHLIVPLKTLRQESQLPSCSHRLIELERRCMEIDAVWVCELIDAQFKAEALAYEDILFKQLTKYTEPVLDELTIIHLKELRDALLSEHQYDINKAPIHLFNNANAILLQLPQLQQQQSVWSRFVNRSELQQADHVRTILQCSLLLRQALQQLPLLKTKPEKIKRIDELQQAVELLLKAHTRPETMLKRLHETTLFKRTCQQEAQTKVANSLLSLPHLVS